MSSAKSPRGYRTIHVKLKKSEITAHTSPRLAHALREIAVDMTLYQGVRFAEILEAVYKQGQKDGARVAFEQMERGLAEAKRLVPHKRPGRPRKR